MSPASQSRIEFKLVELPISKPVIPKKSSIFSASGAKYEVLRGRWLKRQRLRLENGPTGRSTTYLIGKGRPGHNEETQSSDDDDSEATRCILTLGHQTTSQVHPLTILQKGNSDPFNVSAIPIEAEIHEILLFYESNVLPLLVFCMEAGGVSSDVGRAAWVGTLSSLLDEGAPYIYGLLARTSVAMSRSAGAQPKSRLAMKSMQYKNKTSELLRAHLAGGDRHLFEPQVYNAVLSMLITAVSEDRLDEAATHSRMLKHMVQMHRNWTGEDVDLGMLHKILWYDFHRASKALERMTFDSDWMADRFQPGWQQALKTLPAFSAQAELDLDKSIQGEKLRALFITIRHCIEYLGLVNSGSLTTDPSTQVSIASWMTICQGKLINGYLDATGALGEGSRLPTQSVTSVEYHWYCYAKAYIFLAALWWTRCLLGEENAPTRPASTMYNAGGRISPALREALMRSELVSNGLDSLTNGRERLWALYVGAFAELHTGIGRASTTRRTGLEPEDSWFRSELLAQAKRMHLLTWSDLRQLLQGFLYSDSLSPHGSTWFTGA